MYFHQLQLLKNILTNMNSHVTPISSLQSLVRLKLLLSDSQPLNFLSNSLSIFHILSSTTLSITSLILSLFINLSTSSTSLTYNFPLMDLITMSGSDMIAIIRPQTGQITQLMI